MLFLAGACIIATGTLWDLLQVAAWTGMWIENAESESMTGALVTTLSGNELCSLCHIVEATRPDASQDADMLPGSGIERMPLLPLALSEFALRVPSLAYDMITTGLRALPDLAEGPASPPPRRV